VLAGCLLWVSAGCAGASGDDDVGAAVDLCAGDCAPDVAEVIPDGGECRPGEVLGCSEDRHLRLTCTPEGSILETPCLGADGATSLCLNPANGSAYCADCKPGSYRCAGDQDAELCAQDGKGWVPGKHCDTDVTGEICYEGSCIRLCDLNIKQNIYIGCEFWAVDLDNAFVPGGESGFNDAAGSQYSVVVSNPSNRYPAQVAIVTNEGEVLLDSQGGLLPSGPLGPGQLRVYNLPRRDVDGTVLAPLAYRVSSSIPITAYQFNPLQNEGVFSNDASLLLPSNVLGKYHFIMTREQSFDDLRGFLTVVAVNQGTTQVSVEVTAPTLFGYVSSSGQAIPSMVPGEIRKFDLEQFDVLNIETDAIGADLTGSKILSNRAVAVFGGSEAANAPNTNHCSPPQEGQPRGLCEWDAQTPCDDNWDCTLAGFNTCCADHLEKQLFPVKSWGKRYLVSRSFPRNQEKDSFRIIAAEDRTLVTTLPVQLNIPLLNRGEWVDFESGMNFEVIADKPVMVGQFLQAQHAPGPNVNGPEPGDAGIGDPTFILLVPTEQFRKDYVFLAPDKYKLDYITVIAAADAKVYLDCAEIDPLLIVEKCDPVPEDDFQWFASQEFKTFKKAISDGVHSLYSDQPAGVYVYGYDQYVSYGYPAGLDIRDLGLIKEPGEE
jgi:hypothetical protein